MNEENEEIERWLRSAAPRAAPEALRRVVLSSVIAELRDRRQLCWQRLAALAAAALLLFAVGLNAWIASRAEQTMAGIYSSHSTPRAIADIEQAVTSVAGADVGQTIRQQLLASSSSGRSSHVNTQSMRQLIIELETTTKGYLHGKSKKHPEMERDHDHGRARDSSYHQRSPELEGQLTA